MPDPEADTRPFADLNPPYSTIVADPPWTFTHRGGRGRERANRTRLGYTTMTLDAIASLPVSGLGAHHLYLWVTAKDNREGRGVIVARAWGFEPIGEFIWSKSNFGMGAFPRPQHEVLLVCRSDSVSFALNDVGSVQLWRQDYSNNGGKAHSSKPPAALDLVEKASPGPYLELFARQPRLGWDSWGHGYEPENHGT